MGEGAGRPRDRDEPSAAASDDREAARARRTLDRRALVCLLLGLLALAGGLTAVAARGAGERWGSATGVALVLVCAGWSLFGRLLTIAWFYG
jgi:hypothetical protein